MSQSNEFFTCQECKNQNFSQFKVKIKVADKDEKEMCIPCAITFLENFRERLQKINQFNELINKAEKEITELTYSIDSYKEKIQQLINGREVSIPDNHFCASVQSAIFERQE